MEDSYGSTAHWKVIAEEPILDRSRAFLEWWLMKKTWTKMTSFLIIVKWHRFVQVKRYHIIVFKNDGYIGDTYNPLILLSLSRLREILIYSPLPQWNFLIYPHCPICSLRILYVEVIFLYQPQISSVF